MSGPDLWREDFPDEISKEALLIYQGAIEILKSKGPMGALSDYDAEEAVRISKKAWEAAKEGV